MDFDDSTFPMVEIPEEIPAMTLASTVLFPHALMPLYIFEERYQEMLKDVLETNRMFAIVQEDESNLDTFEPLHAMGTVGIIRASHENKDGTSHLVLQGLVRVRIKKIITDEPYRKIKIEPIYTKSPNDSKFFQSDRDKVNQLIHQCERIQSNTPKEFIDFLDSIEEAPVYLDVAIQTLCPSPMMKQMLLETLDTKERYDKFINYLNKQREEEELFKRLQGSTDDDEISLN